jgi:LPS-assembly protein
LTWPFRLGRALYIEPSAGLRQTAWFVDEFQDDAGDEADKDKNAYRTLYDLKLDVSSEFSKVFDLSGGTWQAIRHSVLPRVVYDYLPEEDQDEYPAFFQQIIDRDANGDFVEVPTPLADGVNRIDPLNRITYSLTNTLTSKSRASAAEDAEAAQTEAPRYNDFLRFKLEQYYDIREARGSDRRDPERKRPFSPVRGELEFFPTRYLRLAADAEFDVYDSRLVSRNLSAVLTSPRGDELKLSYRYAEPGPRFYLKDDSTRDVESLYGSLRLKLPFRLTAFASSEYDFEASERIETTLGLLYEAQCWSLDIRFEDDNEDQEISFMFNLYGLGAIGLQ